jgi:sugar lactone lactonase YvrE
MAIRKDSPERPKIDEVSPLAAIPGGELHIRGRFLAGAGRPRVLLGDVPAPVVIGSDSFVIVRVPEGVTANRLTIGNGGRSSASSPCEIGFQIAGNIHAVANPAIDSRGNIYTTFSGSRGQKTPVAVFRIDTNYNVRPFITDLMNATGLAFDREGALYISSRHNGIIYRADSDGSLSVYVEGMGIATGIAFDPEGNLFVGDRSGTIFKISRDRQIYVFATLEPSISAYHLAFGPDGYLYVTGPTTSSNDVIYRISPTGETEIFFQGLGRPQGLAFDAEGRLYVSASLGGRKGILRFEPDKPPQIFLSGPGIVGLAFAPGGALIVATSGALYRLDLNIPGKPLP